MMENVERNARAERRRSSVVLVRTTLGAEEPDYNPVRGEAALSLVWSLTRESWSLAQGEIPQYDRSSTPYRFVPGQFT